MKHTNRSAGDIYSNSYFHWFITSMLYGVLHICAISSYRMVNNFHERSISAFSQVESNTNLSSENTSTSLSYTQLCLLFSNITWARGLRKACWSLWTYQKSKVDNFREMAQISISEIFTVLIFCCQWFWSQDVSYLCYKLSKCLELSTKRVAISALRSCIERQPD